MDGCLTPPESTLVQSTSVNTVNDPMNCLNCVYLEALSFQARSPSFSPAQADLLDLKSP